MQPGSEKLEIALSTRESETLFADGLLSAGAVMLVDIQGSYTPHNSFSLTAWSPGGSSLTLTTKSRDVYQFDVGSGLLLQRQDRNGNRTTYEYVDADQDGRQDELARIVRQGGLQTTFEYVGGSLTGVTDFANRSLQWQTGDGYVDQVTLFEPGFDMEVPVYQFAYDHDDGLLKSITDPRGFTTTITRDGESRRVREVNHPDGYTWNLVPYIGDGLDGTLRASPTGGIGQNAVHQPLREPQASYLDTNGGVWLYQLDAWGLRTAEARPATADSPHADVWQWRRDELGLVLRSILPPGGGGDLSLPTVVIDQDYDETGNRIRRSFPDGTFEEWTYDDRFHQVETYHDTLHREILYQRDGRGNVTLITENELSYADTPPRQTAYAYTGVPADIEQISGGLITIEVAATNSPEAVVRQTEYYDSGIHVGLVRAVHEAANAGDSAAVATTRFHYDAQRNLAEQIDPLGRTTSYVYDQLDRLHQQIDPAPGTGDHGPPVTTFIYDAAGNNTQIIDAPRLGCPPPVRRDESVGE